MPLPKQEINRRFTRILLGKDPKTKAPPEERLDETRQELLETWKNSDSNFAFLTGKDIDGRPMIWTRDERDDVHPVKPFPRGKRYIDEFCKVLRNEQVVILDKSRQMLMTTIAVLDTLCNTIFKMAQTSIISKTTEDEAKQVIDDKLRFPYSQLPDWFKDLYPITPRPRAKVTAPNTGSYILAVGENVAGAEARGCTASRVLIDEAAFQRELEYIVGAVIPMGKQLVLLTTANLGNPGAKFYRDELLEKGR